MEIRTIQSKNASWDSDNAGIKDSRVKAVNAAVAEERIRIVDLLNRTVWIGFPSK